MEKHTLEDKEESPSKKQALQKPANEEYIIVAHYKPYPHECPVDYGHQCDPDAEDDDDRCCRPQENECTCSDIEFCVDYYQIPKSELGKKDSLFESCLNSMDVRRSFLKELSCFEDYLVYDGDKLGPGVPLVLSQGCWEIVSI